MEMKLLMASRSNHHLAVGLHPGQLLWVGILFSRRGGRGTPTPGSLLRSVTRVKAFLVA